MNIQSARAGTDWTTTLATRLSAAGHANQSSARADLTAAFSSRREPVKERPAQQSATRG